MREILTFLFLLESLILILKASTASTSTTFCLQPDVPENCHVIFAQPGPYQIGTVAKYNCALGYERIGSDERKCIENGQWSDVAPLCAIDVAANKPAEQSSGQSTAQNAVLSLPNSQNAVLSLPNCALTDSSKSSWWSVNLLGTFDIRAISITLGHLSSELVDIRMETSNGTMSSCAREVSNLKNSTILYCSADSVRSIMVHAESRLHLCSIKVFAVNARKFIYSFC
uniref:Sushi domain-containing protein n=1 Tax=Panagrolaimus sp. PS1159 TaxID=55785 RepID=A0AC35GBA4_9BILA